MDFIHFLSLLDKFPLELITLIAVVYVVVKIKSADEKIQSVDEKIQSVDGKLGNHITDTNKKIDQLGARIESQGERLGARIENQSERFDRLYEILLKEKGQK